MKTHFILIIALLSINCLVAQNYLELREASLEIKTREEIQIDSQTANINNSQEIATFFRDGSNTSGLANGGAFYIGRKSKFIDLVGEIYLNEKWQKSVIITKENKKIVTLGRYRFYDDKMEILFNGEEMILFIEEVKAFAINGRVFIPRFYTNKKKDLLQGWFELLSEGSINLYKRYYTIIQRSDYNAALDTGNKNDALVKREEFFYHKQDSSKNLQELKKGRSNILTVLKKREKAVNSYAKKNYIRWSKEEDLIKLFDFYNKPR